MPINNIKMNNAEATDFVSRMTALGLYIKRIVSIGYCAQIVGMTELEFISFLSQNHISIFRFGLEDELLKDVENA